LSDVDAPVLARAGARPSVRGLDRFWVGVAGLSLVLAAVLGWYLEQWPPHEDETLALFVGRSSVGELLRTVITERGGAPLHFLFAWVIVHLGGGLTALRVVSLVFAVASVPLIALLGARLADRTVGLVAAAISCSTWMLLFHGVYGRMYSMFLFTSALSFLALLSALDGGGRKRFALWGLAAVAVLATHPYAVLVVAAQVLYVLLRRERVWEALVTTAAVGVVGFPFWWADLVLRDRFDVGVGGGGTRLGSPGAVLTYLGHVAGDSSTGYSWWLVPVLLLALAGAILLARRNRDGLRLVLCVVAVPAVAFTLATLGKSTSPEARHLIFTLPFFATLLALPLVELVRNGRDSRLAPVVAAVALVLLLVGNVRWAHEKTPKLFDGDPAAEVQARNAAAHWLASGARPDDVLLGYEPLYLRAWEENRGSFSANALPRADPALFASALKDVSEPLGRGVWVFDASDTTNVRERQTIARVIPKPASDYEARVFGPYLVIRSRKPLVTRARFVAASIAVLRVGRGLHISDADVNLHTVLVARSRL
jgi:4-amino-4-deoxy-L-arabinose transferase-like glycosyltransferase